MLLWAENYQSINNENALLVSTLVEEEERIIEKLLVIVSFVRIAFLIASPFVRWKNGAFGSAVDL
jgi:hypothetical protein